MKMEKSVGEKWQNSGKNALNSAQAADFIEEFKIAPRGAILKLEVYATLLLKWNKKINLVAPNTIPDLWRRHILDSAQVLIHINRCRENSGGNPRLIDVGSGAGLPGLIIAALAENISVYSVESDVRKCAFQLEAARQMGLKNFTLINKRTEQLKPEDFGLHRNSGEGSNPGEPSASEAAEQEKVSKIFREQNKKSEQAELLIITARAFASLNDILYLTRSFNTKECLNLFLKGSNVGKEIDAALENFSFDFALHQSLTEENASVLELRNVKFLKDS